MMATRRYTDPTKWPRDHHAKHSAAAKKGWKTRTGGYTNPKTRAEYAKFRKQKVAAEQEAKILSAKRGQKEHERVQKKLQLESEEEKAARFYQKAIDARLKEQYNHGVSLQRYLDLKMGKATDRARIKRILEEEEKAKKQLLRVRSQLQAVG